ncbi:hypothetical protein [Litoreibacter roseus]|uniref:PAS domain-containing protein n=1 Tax=Litoreibacter roseus TaxID=2601869 RepID=A0A6N6JCL9_9RHOB|nr:hypothetical protein [Litoreibacter roseus]GFE63834.1 hypothetical protein KIN_09080 [Litoreibacter roseus]
MNESSLTSQTTIVSERDVLAGILAASTDACWCMEFDEPVDLTVNDGEVVRQIFENGPRWRFCNDAMAQLYLLGPDEDLNARPVSEIFPRNAQNEKFIQNLLSNGFEVNGAPALDRRYDGVEIHVENDVRAHINGGQLIRMFGIVRDVGKHYRREADLSAQLSTATHLIEILPDPVIGIDASGAILVSSAAADRLLDRPAGALVGEIVGQVIDAAWGMSAKSLVLALQDGIVGSSGQVVVDSMRIEWTIERRIPTADRDLAGVLVLRTGVAYD